MLDVTSQSSILHKTKVFAHGWTSHNSHERGIFFMKKYAGFIISFVIISTLLHTLSGMLMTLFYVPDFSVSDQPAAQTVQFGATTSVSLVVSVLAASIAYYLSQIIFNKKLGEEMKDE